MSYFFLSESGVVFLRLQLISFSLSPPSLSFKKKKGAPRVQLRSLSSKFVVFILVQIRIF